MRTRNLLRQTRLFGSDFDGVHTDGAVYVDQNGVESVRCNRKDGLGYDMLRRANIPAFILSREANEVVAQRARKLRVPCRHGAQEKVALLAEQARSSAIDQAHVCYMGDDLNDLDALAWAGIPVAPADAHSRILKLVRSRHGLVTRTRGGEGAVREAIEFILSAKGLPLAF